MVRARPSGTCGAVGGGQRARALTATAVGPAVGAAATAGKRAAHQLIQQLCDGHQVGAAALPQCARLVSCSAACAAGRLGACGMERAGWRVRAVCWGVCASVCACVSQRERGGGRERERERLGCLFVVCLSRKEAGERARKRKGVYYHAPTPLARQS